ncbi:hypothetical protein [Paenibacillus daejeonensis]|uniref:hypothetical protein n=1 Tax=Paenibacillus daejeonensis TaxID=135193 RepID=UPI00035E912E|nr:hypothetical protein [Paenibacillus daejeonensis]
MYQVIKGIVKHEGASYRKGSLFDAPHRDVGHLLKDRYIQKYEPLVEEGDSDTFDEELEFLPTPDVFAKLSAAKQREMLKDAELEPAGNADERVSQYTLYYATVGEEDGV